MCALLRILRKCWNWPDSETGPWYLKQQLMLMVGLPFVDLIGLAADAADDTDEMLGQAYTLNNLRRWSTPYTWKWCHVDVEPRYCSGDAVPDWAWNAACNYYSQEIRKVWTAWMKPGADERVDPSAFLEMVRYNCTKDSGFVGTADYLFQSKSGHQVFAQFVTTFDRFVY